MGDRIFGTDGIRGRAGEGWLAPDRVATLGRIAGQVLASNGQSRGQSRGRSSGRALLGHDGRRSGPELEAALASGLAAGGIEPVSAGLISTPGLALLARLGSFELAAMISASHNPAEDNGIKLLGGLGEKLSDDAERAIEAQLHDDRLHDEAAPVERGTPLRHDPEFELQYLRYLVEKAAAGLSFDGVSIVVDCANGGASRVAPRVFGRLGAKITAIHAEPDGDNINRGCGSTEPGDLQSEVRRQSAAVGIGLDGDGDRCILVDETGRIVHGDGILTVCAMHAVRQGQLESPSIVATVMSNKGLHRALRDVGVTVETVDVGDRNVVERMRAKGIAIGGEQSGHIVFGGDHFFIGDGIYTALRVLRVMYETGKPLSELAAPYQPFPQVLLNVRVASKPSLTEFPDIAENVADIEAELGEDGRVLLRYSGTEPLARVMIEGPDAQRIQAMAQGLAERIEAEIGA